MSEQEPAVLPAGAIAIVGMAGRFPGAQDVDAYWRNLREGLESIATLSREALLDAGVPERLISDPNYVPARGVLEGVDQFDAAFFGYSPREATTMDPQQRMFLECAWEALESAAYDPRTFRGLIGVYGGATASSYQHLVYADPKTMAQTDPLSVAIGNDIAFLTTRVSYKLDLRGPSCPVQTACSTALVAIHLACQSLLNAECDLALAGAASVRVPQNCGYPYQPSGILSPDGHCRPFDHRAQGTLFSNGLGVVVLKRLDDAVADGDFIHAVIRGSAVNNDGSQKASFTAPAIGGQSDVIADALMHADVEPETISYIEAHGTATSLGDSIEMQALNRVFPVDRARNYCAIGSVKSNIGHLDAAAGMAGLIKTTLALRHRLLPPSLHFERANPDINFANSAFRVNAALSEWRPSGDEPLRAGVSAFGFGGTNAHVVLEEAPERGPSGPSRAWQLLTLSSDTESGLDATTSRLVGHLRANPGLPFPDVAFTLKVGRRGFRHRRIVACRTASEAVDLLEHRDPTVFEGTPLPERAVVFMFPGQGSQHPGMGRDLYEHEPSFRATVDECATLLQGPLGLDLRTLMYPAVPTDADADRLKQTRYAQPALFVIEYALARLWMEWGVNPECFIGHSIGEYVAACLAGVMSLQDALRLVALRGTLMEQMPAGAMLAVPLPEERLRRYLGPDLWLAAVNGPATCVVSGSHAAIAALEGRLEADGLASQRLQTSHAFHSGLMDAAVAPFVAAVSKVSLHAPRIPFVSNLTGRWIEPAQATDPAYWGRHLREAVRFADGIADLMSRDQRVFLEVGPGQALATLVRPQARNRATQIVLSSLRHARQDASDLALVLTALGRLWASGVEVSWSGFYAGETRHRLPLPTYAFERQRYWVGKPAARAEIREERRAEKIPSIERWFYTPSWQRRPPSPQRGAVPQEAVDDSWIVFAEPGPFGDALVSRLEAAGARCVVVAPGEVFARTGERGWTIVPGQVDHYRAVLTDLPAGQRLSIVHAWGASASDPEAGVPNGFMRERSLGFGSLLRLAQVLAEPSSRTGRVRIGFVTAGAQDVTGAEPLSPGAATAVGLCRVIPQEQLEIACTCIDVEAAAAADAVRADALAANVLSELTGRGRDRIVAFRGPHRWVLHYDQVALGPAGAVPSMLRDRGVYLITGGLGDIGLHTAEYLARTVRARLALIGRSAFPADAEWDQYLAEHDESDPTARQIVRLRRIVAAGGEVMLVRADVGEIGQMRQAFADVEARFGAINGVVHGAGLVVGDAFRPLTETDEDICRRQFTPKIAGLCVLDVLLHERPAPDFVLLVSSLSSVLGGLRFAAYASANAFLDTFAAWRRRTTGIPWLAINWDSWLRAEDEARLGKVGTSGANEYYLTGEEGVDALARILSSDVGSQIVVSVGDLQARIDQWISLERASQEEAGAVESDAPRHPRPSLQTEYRAPIDPLEQAIAGIWQELLGVDRIGVNDSFFELGGDSLLGVQVIARLRKQLSVSVSAVSLYEGPTVALLADVVRAANPAASAEQGKSRGDRRREQKLRRQGEVTL